MILGCNQSVDNSWDADISVYYLKDGNVKFVNHYEWMGGEYEESCTIIDLEEDSILQANSDSITGGHYFITFPSTMDDSIETIIEDYFVSNKKLPKGVEVTLAQDDIQ